MRVFLSGPMGSGKSTLGPRVAVALGAPFVDLDRVIEERAGKSVSEVFSERGEAAFRALEAETLDALLDAPADPLVVALGGGTVTQHALRRRVQREGVVVTLEASAEALAQRLEGTRDRPLLAGSDRAAALARILEARAPLYAEAHLRIASVERDPAALVDEIVRESRALSRSVLMPLGARTYVVEIEAGTLDRLAPCAESQGLLRGLLVTDSNVGPAWGAQVEARLGARVAGRVTLAAGEEHKTLGAVEAIWDAALSAGVDRGAAIFALGGGVVGDLAGFAAATLLRGVRFLQLPTSLLAMVDSSVGGKTGFDRPQGKNLVGAFHQPTHVICDIEVLSTLPDVELRSGLAEVVKSAWLAGEKAVAMLERDAALLLARDAEATRRAVRMSVALKASIVADDEHESGARALLNLGHTVGHAIEAASGYTLRHGEAVALGMLAAMRVQRGLGVACAADAVRLRALLEALELPVDLDAHLGDSDALRRFLGADKKRAGADVRFILPGEPGASRIERVPLDDVLRLASAS